MILAYLKYILFYFIYLMLDLNINVKIIHKFNLKKKKFSNFFRPKSVYSTKINQICVQNF